MHRKNYILLTAALGVAYGLAPAALAWQARTVPVDQSAPAPDASWRATAANLLTGAGYGLGGSNAVRAQTIYDQLGGYTGETNVNDAAGWWLRSSGFNIWKANPYQNVSYAGAAAMDGPGAFGLLGNELRNGNLMSIQLGTSAQGRSLTLWGDSGPSGSFASGQSPAAISAADGTDAVVGTQSYAIAYGPAGWTMPYSGGSAAVNGYTMLSRAGGIQAFSPLTSASSLVVTAPRNVGDGLASSWIYLVRADDAVTNAYALDVKITGQLAQRQYNGSDTVIMNDAVNLGDELSKDTHFLLYGHWRTSGNDYDMLGVPQAFVESASEIKGAMGFGRIATPGWAVWQPVAEIVVPIGDSFIVSGQYGAGTGASGSIQYFPFSDLNVITPEPATGLMLAAAALLLARRSRAR